MQVRVQVKVQVHLWKAGRLHVAIEVQGGVEASQGHVVHQEYVIVPRLGNAARTGAVEYAIADKRVYSTSRSRCRWRWRNSVGAYP